MIRRPVERPRGALRPGAGQARSRAPRGWRPETIVDAYLVTDERIVLEETRSVRGFLVGQAHWMVLTAVVAVALLSLGTSVTNALAALVVAAFAIWLVVRALQAWFTRYVVTDLRILAVRGVLNRHAEFIPWGKVTDVGRTESLLQWIAHTATIRIESANERSGLRTIDDVDDPGYFYRVIVRMVDAKQGRVGDVTMPERP